VKTTIKINVVLHTEDDSGPSLETLPPTERVLLETSRKAMAYQLAFHEGFTRNVVDAEDAKRLAGAIRGHVEGLARLLDLKKA
jgi:hypothetical protein